MSNSNEKEIELLYDQSEKTPEYNEESLKMVWIIE
jgi:hypothetical protein